MTVGQMEKMLVESWVVLKGLYLVQSMAALLVVLMVAKTGMWMVYQWDAKMVVRKAYY